MYKKLSFEERKRIEEFCLENLNNTKISEILDRGISTIKDEIRKNGGHLKYNAIEAQNRANLIRQNRIDKLSKIKENDIKLIIEEHAKGKSVNKIRKELNVSYKTVSRALHERGISTSKTSDILYAKIQGIEEHIKLIYELIEEIRNDK